MGVIKKISRKNLDVFLVEMDVIKKFPEKIWRKNLDNMGVDE